MSMADESTLMRAAAGVLGALKGGWAMRGPRKTAPKVRDGRVQRKNNWRPTLDTPEAARP